MQDQGIPPFAACEVWCKSSGQTHRLDTCLSALPGASEVDTEWIYIHFEIIVEGDQVRVPVPRATMTLSDRRYATFFPFRLFPICFTFIFLTVIGFLETRVCFELCVFNRLDEIY